MNVESNCIVKIKILNKSQCIKIHKNYDKQYFYKHHNF